MSTRMYHYFFEAELLRVMEGQAAPGIHLVLGRSSRVSRLDHAACLGEQLANAALSQQGFNYWQAGA